MSFGEVCAINIMLTESPIEYAKTLAEPAQIWKEEGGSRSFTARAVGADGDLPTIYRMTCPTSWSTSVFAKKTRCRACCQKAALSGYMFSSLNAKGSFPEAP